MKNWNWSKISVVAMAVCVLGMLTSQIALTKRMQDTEKALLITEIQGADVWFSWCMYDTFLSSRIKDPDLLVTFCREGSLSEYEWRMEYYYNLSAPNP